MNQPRGSLLYFLIGARWSCRASAIALRRSGTYAREVRLRCSTHSAADQRPGTGGLLQSPSERLSVSRRSRDCADSSELITSASCACTVISSPVGPSVVGV